MHFSSDLRGTAKAKKDEHEVEYWINPQREGKAREPTAKPHFSIHFTVESW